MWFLYIYVQYKYTNLSIRIKGKLEFRMSEGQGKTTYIMCDWHPKGERGSVEKEWVPLLRLKHGGREGLHPDGALQVPGASSRTVLLRSWFFGGHWLKTVWAPFHWSPSQSTHRTEPKVKTQSWIKAIVPTFCGRSKDQFTNYQQYCGKGTTVLKTLWVITLNSDEH